ncbi:MAG: 3-oxosteroid 1-dehydrogenase [Porticoccaceae bacterium]|nr:MAG: 3-oxosteroid 1-dehydrogenase [Porticoccaceae bacterium]
MAAFDEQFDFVVVGSGGGCMTASLYLARRGKRVLVLEKEPLVGGTTARSGGVMWIPNNPFMRRDGIPDSEEQALLYLDTLAAERPEAPGNTPERRRAYVREAPRMVEFLLEAGIELDRTYGWPDYYDEKPGAVKAGRSVVARYFDLKELGPWADRLQPGFLPMPAALEELLAVPFYKRSWKSRRILLAIAWRTLLGRLTGKRYTSAGAALQGRLLKAVLAAGVEVRPESPVRELLVEGERVVGVRAEIQGKARCIGAALGVLVNAGGFARNQQMRDRYQPGTSAEWSSTIVGDTGELILEMERIGAVLAQMEEMVGNQCCLPPGTRYEEIKQGMQAVTAKPHAILVDQSGRRYQNEGGSYMEYCQNMLARHREVPAIPSYAVFDVQFLDNYMLAGTFPGRRKPKSWYESGFLKRADSLAELARQLHMEPAVLEETVARFNRFCDQGRDEDFGRGEREYDRWLGDPTREGIARTLGRIERPPFFAVAVYPGDVGTFGGVVTDEFARVLRADGSAIPGLYATGVSTAAVMGRSYPGAGASVGPSLTWGYVAAKHALGEAG